MQHLSCSDCVTVTKFNSKIPFAPIFGQIETHGDTQSATKNQLILLSLILSVYNNVRFVFKIQNLHVPKKKIGDRKYLKLFTIPLL